MMIYQCDIWTILVFTQKRCFPFYCLGIFHWLTWHIWWKPRYTARFEICYWMGSDYPLRRTEIKQSVSLLDNIFFYCLLSNKQPLSSVDSSASRLIPSDRFRRLQRLVFHTQQHLCHCLVLERTMISEFIHIFLNHSCPSQRIRFFFLLKSVKTDTFDVF